MKQVVPKKTNIDTKYRPNNICTHVWRLYMELGKSVAWNNGDVFVHKGESKRRKQLCASVCIYCEHNANSSNATPCSAIKVRYIFCTKRTCLNASKAAISALQKPTKIVDDSWNLWTPIQLIFQCNTVITIINVVMSSNFLGVHFGFSKETF